MQTWVHGHMPHRVCKHGCTHAVLAHHPCSDVKQPPLASNHACPFVPRPAPCPCGLRPPQYRVSQQLVHGGMLLGVSPDM